MSARFVGNHLHYDVWKICQLNYSFKLFTHNRTAPDLSAQCRFIDQGPQARRIFFSQKLLPN